MSSKPLQNARHERYAQELAKGKSQTEAYESAGYSPDRGAASRLSANVSVKARLEAIQAKSANKVAIDKAYVLKRAVDLHETASRFMETPEGFDPKAANVASRTLDQIGRHVDVQAWRDQTDVNLLISVDDAIARLDRARASEAIEADYTDITDNG